MIKRLVLVVSVCLTALLISSCSDSGTESGVQSDMSELERQHLPQHGGGSVVFSKTDSSGSMTVQKPNGGESWSIDSRYQIRWNKGVLGGNVRVLLYKWKTGSKYVADFYRTIVSSTTNDGSYTWTIPADIPQGDKYMVAVQSRVNWDIYDFGDNYFGIKSCNAGNVSSSVAFEGYVNKYGDLLNAYNASGGSQSKTAWGKTHYCNSGRTEGRTYCGLSASSCSSSTTTTTTTSSNAFEGYVNKYGDLLAVFNATGGSKANWGKNHYCNHGRAEGRTYPGLSAASCSSSTTTTTVWRYTSSRSARCSRICRSLRVGVPSYCVGIRSHGYLWFRGYSWCAVLSAVALLWFKLL